MPCLKPNKYQRTGRDHFERWKLKGTSNHQSRIVEEALQEAIEENSEDSSVLSLSDLLETEIEKIGNFVKTLNFETEGKAFSDCYWPLDGVWEPQGNSDRDITSTGACW